ncbi:DUF58 domain-containing protein [Candidatus Riflebacteria bacterium]
MHRFESTFNKWKRKTFREKIHWFLVNLLAPPIDFEVTVRGQVFIFLTILVGTFAIRLENGFLFLILSLMISAILTSGILNSLSLQALSGRRNFPEELFARKWMRTSVSLENSSHRYDSYFISLANLFKPMNKGEIRFEWQNLIIWKLLNRKSKTFDYVGYLFHLGKGEKKKIEIQYRFPARGIYEIEPFACISDFPFGFFLKSRKLGKTGEFIVFPEIQRINLIHLSNLSGLDFIRIFRSQQEGQYLSHLNEVEHLASSRRIHWKQLASKDELVRKEFEGTDSQDVNICFDSRMPFALTEMSAEEEKLYFELYEERISFLASLLQLFITKNWRINFLWPDAHMDSGKGVIFKRQIWKKLAIFDVDGPVECVWTLSDVAALKGLKLIVSDCFTAADIREIRGSSLLSVNNWLTWKL